MWRHPSSSQIWIIKGESNRLLMAMASPTIMNTRVAHSLLLFCLNCNLINVLGNRKCTKHFDYLENKTIETDKCPLNWMTTRIIQSREDSVNVKRAVSFRAVTNDETYLRFLLYLLRSCHYHSLISILWYLFNSFGLFQLHQKPGLVNEWVNESLFFPLLAFVLSNLKRKHVMNVSGCVC